MRKSYLILLCSLMLCLFSNIHCSAQPSAEQDVLYHVLQEKVAEQFKLYAHKTIPCFELIYEVSENQENHCAVFLGSPTENRTLLTRRNLSITMSVGNWELNNQSLPVLDGEYLINLPCTNDTALLSKIIGNATADVYKRAVDDYYFVISDTVIRGCTNKRPYQRPVDTFHYEAPYADLSYNQKELIEKLCGCTGYYGPMSEVCSFTARMEYVVSRNYYFDNYGSAIVNNKRSTDLTMTMYGDLPENTVTKVYHVEVPDDLPPTDLLIDEAATLYNDLLEQRKQLPSQAKNFALPRQYDENVETATYFSDVIFQAMQDEVDADLSELRIDDNYAPYYISYLVTDAHFYHTISSLGYPTFHQDYDMRFVEPTIKIGNDIFNNTHYKNDVYEALGNYMAIDNNYNAMRAALRMATNDAYGNTVKQYVNKSNTWQQSGIPMNKLLPDRSVSNIKTDIQYKNFEHIDKGTLQSITDGVSALFAHDSLLNRISYSSVSINGVQGNAYFYASDHVQYAQPVSFFVISIAADGTNPIGKDVYDTHSYYCKNIDELNNVDLLQSWAKSFISEFCRKLEAPAITEAYYGPVLVTEQAAGEWLMQASPQLAAMRNTYQLDSKNSEQCLDKRVISPILDIRTADNLHTFDDKGLIGSYDFDAEGVVPEENMDVIRRGKLITLLNDRTPVNEILYSNGHQRICLKNNHFSTSIGPGVLKVSSHQSLNEPKLEQLLLKKAKEAGYNYAYIITNLFVNDMETTATIYRISVKNGKKELMEQVSFNPDFFWDLNQVTATAQEKVAYNALSFLESTKIIPVSIIHPKSLLFEHFPINPNF
ncbi:MAG: metallopeptidase TldD-related protein [Bacteroidales bacterium]|nr:metallopeptidase TldD-related protein [Bacteroidales bacterium]